MAKRIRFRNDQKVGALDEATKIPKLMDAGQWGLADFGLDYDQPRARCVSETLKSLLAFRPKVWVQA